MKLQVEQGTFSYGTGNPAVLKQLSFSLESGQILAVLGANGVGKTTFLRCLLGLLPWTDGRTLIDGQDIRRMPAKELWQRVAYVPQMRRAPVAYTVEDMVLLGRAGRIGTFAVPGAEDFQIVHGVLQRTGLGSLKNRLCTELSGGEYQLVLLARALAGQPQLLVLDEPEANLDFKNQLLILDLLEALAAEGLMCIFNTHYPEHAIRWSRLALLLGRDGHYDMGESKGLLTAEKLAFCYDMGEDEWEKISGQRCE